jgi:hypothetical protein
MSELIRLELPTVRPGLSALIQEWRERFGDIIAVLMVGQVQALDSIREGSVRLPTTESALTAHLKAHSPKAGPDGKRWAVRACPLRGGYCWTVGVFQKKDDAEAFKRFWGTWVNTEVKLAEVDIGVNPWEKDQILDDTERWVLRLSNLDKPRERRNLERNPKALGKPAEMSLRLLGCRS